MNPPTFDVRSAFAGLPVVTLDQFGAAAYKLGQYIMRVTNSEGSSGFGVAIARDYPGLEQAVGVLGHALARQAYPDAPLPGRGDETPDAHLAAAAYASVGTWLMASVPDVDHRLGPYAAGCVVAALYGHGSPPSPLARAVTTKALGLLDQVIQVCSTTQMTPPMHGQGATTAEPSAPVLASDLDDAVRDDQEQDGHDSPAARA